MSPIPHAHAVGTAFVVGVLLYFCVVFFRRANRKLLTAKDNGETKRATYIKRRMTLYVAAGVLQTLAAVPFLMHELADKATKPKNIGVFVAEAMTLYAFAICWYTSARTNQWLEHELDRKTVFRPKQAPVVVVAVDPGQGQPASKVNPPVPAAPAS